MLRTRSHTVMALAAVVLALSACTSNAEGGSTDPQDKSSTSAPAITQQQSTTAPTATPTATADPPEPDTQKALEDVKLGALRVEPQGALSAEVAITNNTTKASNYIVDLELMAADGKTQLDTAMVSAAGVAAGKTTKVKAQFGSTEKLPKGAKVTIVGVARIAV